MRVVEQVALTPLTTLGVGGIARFFIEAKTEQDIEEGIAYARTHELPLLILGGGSNLLVPDIGVEGVVLHMTGNALEIEETEKELHIHADTGVSWNAVVDAANERGVFGIENLAGIPGTLGGAAVQNIGAYGAEFSSVFAYADCVHTETGTKKRIERSGAAFGYRTSIFKQHPEYVLTRIGLTLTKDTQPNLSYADVARAVQSRVPLSTPNQIASAIRAIRAQKFPPTGSAGSFFKNPVISNAEALALKARYPELPIYEERNGQKKVSLAWILDHVLSLKGYTKGNVRLYENQPLVIVASEGATATDIELFAQEIASRVKEAVGITIEREVETFETRK
jgi:UDP-N-acetylmuramate dehydrogenase